MLVLDIFLDFQPEHTKYLEMCNPLRDQFRSFGSYEKSKELYLLNEEFSYAQHDEKFRSRWTDF